MTAHTKVTWKVIPHSSLFQSGTTAATPKPAVAAQKTSDLIFQAPKVGPIKLCPDDLLAVYHPESQGVILVTRKQYDQVYCCFAMTVIVVFALVAVVVVFVAVQEIVTKIKHISELKE